MGGKLPQLEHRPAGARLELVQRALPQGTVAGPLQRRKDGPLVSESNLALGRMHVDIDLGRIDEHIQHGKGKTIRLAQAPIRLLDGEHQVAMLNAPAIYQDDDVIPSAAMQGGRAYQSVHT